ncbi:hypothetical protein QBC39DRAFT_391913 [Podospora conica]|nr:hypothetical protein QBC39DRAFT_391913 [Schizothecium conicum]
MTTSPTPREMRRLASDHDFVLGAQHPRRLGLGPFIATHLSLVAAFIAGAILVIVAIVYASTTSSQLLECPAWATDCRQLDKWTVEHLGTVQGIITLVFFIGLSALGCVALAFCESSVWALLALQKFKIRELEAYLSVMRGSVLAAPVAAMSVQTIPAGLILAAAVVVTLIPLTSIPLVGFAFTPTWRSVILEGNYTTGGGIGELYAQQDLPTSIIARVLEDYHLWSTNPSSEPMPEYRDWYVDRMSLSSRGGFSAMAVQLSTTISCVPRPAQQLNKDGVWYNAFVTNVTRTNINPGKQTNMAEVWVRLSPHLVIWADQFEFLSPKTTKTTLVFAALNGTIDGGFPSPFVSSTVTNASSMACVVTISAADALLTVGTPPVVDSPLTISSLETMRANSPEKSLNELLLWLTIAPTLISQYTTPSNHDLNAWTIPDLTHLIHLSIGALVQAISTTPLTSQPQMATLPFTTPTKSLLPSRSLLLLLLPSLLLALTAAIATWSAKIHKRNAIPVMRMAGLAETLKSAQTGYLRAHAATDGAKTYLPANDLGEVRVGFGVDGGGDGMAGLGGEGQS